MNTKSRIIIQMTVVAAILTAITLVGSASSLAQGLTGAEAAEGPLKVFLPLVNKNYSGPTISSFELIEQARMRGEINTETSLVYKVFAVFGDPRLPLQYKGNADPARDTYVLSQIKAKWSLLSPGAQALLEPFFLPPTAPGSWMELQQEQDQPAFAASEAVAGPQGTVEWKSLSRPGGDVKVWYQTRYPGDDALAVDILSDMEDIVWPKLTELMGRGPLGDDGLANNGGDGLFDIYLVRIDSQGVSVPYNEGCEAVPSYALIDGESTQLHGTITHEFFHAIIWGYTFSKGCLFPEYSWLNEASATWTEDYISQWLDTGNSEHSYASTFLGYPDFPLESLGEDHEYGAYLWPFYLARTFQPEIIRTIWDATGSKDSLAAIDGAIPGGFLEQWPVFSRLNLNQPPVDQYKQWDGLDQQAAPYDTHLVELGGLKELRIPMQASVNHLGARSFYFNFTDPEVDKVRFENSYRFFSGSEPRAKVQALFKIEGQDWKLEDWTVLPYRNFCRSQPGQRIMELVVIFSNSEWVNRLDTLNPGSPGPSLLFTDQPCTCELFSSVQKWNGQVQFTFTTSATDGDESMTYNHSATVNLQMVPDYENSSYVVWKHDSYSGTGVVNDTHTDTTYYETLVGSGALLPGGTAQDSPKAMLGVYLPTCTFEFYLLTGIPAQHTIYRTPDTETVNVSTGLGAMDINDIPLNQLTGSRTVPAIYYPHGEPSWYVPESRFDNFLELLMGNNFGEATVSWSFTPAD